MTVQEALEQRKQNMDLAEQIREDAIENGTWGTKNETTIVESAISPGFDSTPLAFGICGFVLGVLVAVLACRVRIKKIRSECETRVSEARASLDRMISMMSKE